MSESRRATRAGAVDRVMLVMPGDSSSAGPGSGTVEVLRINAVTCRENGAEVIALVPENPQLVTELEPWCDFVVTLPASGSIRRFGRSFFPIAKQIRRFKPSLVHFHVPDYRWGLDGPPATLVSRATKCVRTEHNPLLAPPNRYERPLVWLSDRFVDQHVYVSSGNRDRFENGLSWRSNGLVNVNTIDPHQLGRRSTGEGLRAACDAKDGEKIAVFVAVSWALDESRRPLRPVIEALPLVGDHWRLAVLGDGDRHEAIALAKSLGVADRLSFLGPRSNAAQLTAEADLLVAASHFEGCSIAMLEAWFGGTPIVSTIVDGVSDFTGPDYVEDVTTKHGDVTGFANQWRQSESAQSRTSIGNARAMRRLTEEHSLERHQERTWDSYIGLVSGV